MPHTLNRRDFLGLMAAGPMAAALPSMFAATGERPNDAKHANTPGGVAYEASVGGGEAGWPFMVMLDPNGKPIVDSYRPDRGSKTGKSNTGYPDAREEVDWFVEMLRRGAPSLSRQDLASVQAWLNAHSTTQHH